MTVLVNDGLPDEGLKLADVPVGRPEAERLTDLVGPLTRVTVTVVEALLPCSAELLAGSAETEKSNGAVTVRVYASVLVRPPPAAIIVMM